jgi:hypothetical protein
VGGKPEDWRPDSTKLPAMKAEETNGQLDDIAYDNYNGNVLRKISVTQDELNPGPDQCTSSKISQ